MTQPGIEPMTSHTPGECSTTGPLCVVLTDRGVVGIVGLTNAVYKFYSNVVLTYQNTDISKYKNAIVNTEYFIC